MRLGFFLREALRSMSRNAVPSFAAMASVLVTLLVLGVFIPIVQATTGAANDVRNRVLVNVYLDTNATTADVERVRRRIEDDVPVRRQACSSSPSARPTRSSAAGTPTPTSCWAATRCPDTFRITPDKPDNALKLRDALSPQTPGGGRTTLDPAIDRSRTPRTRRRRSSSPRAS